MTWAFNLPTVVLTISLFVLSNSMLRPAVSSLTSKRSTVGQGVAMGLNNSFMSLGRITGPLLAGLLFDLGQDLPYMVGGAIMLLGFIIALLWLGNNAPEESRAAAE
jgi:DHA1 family multidrug resistance protein-like MFS transporter